MKRECAKSHRRRQGRKITARDAKNPAAARETVAATGSNATRRRLSDIAIICACLQVNLVAVHPSVATDGQANRAAVGAG